METSTAVMMHAELNAMMIRFCFLNRDISKSISASGSGQRFYQGACKDLPELAKLFGYHCSQKQPDRRALLRRSLKCSAASSEKCSFRAYRPSTPVPDPVVAKPPAAPAPSPSLGEGGEPGKKSIALQWVPLPYCRIVPYTHTRST
ncbi:hypothetical protein PAPYR_12052 [Paratrimastix pyriformis]|uniref:Uncharacterized protein n=1 Tax=Paratrimastix pyriformis TaxID=342808 RepID=A0ABQ8U4X5_9EUKA|nr:hypothetical protein PAPYR_12052 [Paratrimastix pyriformis]